MSHRDESGWVIEKYINGELRYWNGWPLEMSCWVTENLRAIRFARETDAAYVLSWLLKGEGRAVEHVWTAPPVGGMK
jgi:hypothetical protein